MFRDLGGVDVSGCVCVFHVFFRKEIRKGELGVGGGKLRRGRVRKLGEKRGDEGGR